VTGIEVDRLNDRTKWDVAVTDETAAEDRLLRLVLASEGVGVADFRRKEYQLEDIFMNIVEASSAAMTGSVEGPSPVRSATLWDADAKPVEGPRPELVEGGAK
jgi:hypothetical protein